MSSVIINKSYSLYEKLAHTTLNFLAMRGKGNAAFLRIWRKSESINELLNGLNATNKYNLDILVKNKVKLIFIWEENYPSLLRNIHNPPVVIYYVGNYQKQKIENAFAVVGMRKNTKYGEKYAIEFTSELVAKGFSIVSGMAFGIDKIAHLTSTKLGGYSVAVLPANVNMPSPISNYKLFNSILATGGCIISEHPPEVKIHPGMFAARNRIIAGLSKAVLIVEAGEDSGSLITADLAFEQDRFIFAIPGDLNKSSSAGTNRIIKENKAKLVQTPNDIFSELGLTIVNKDREVTKIEMDGLSQKIYDILLGYPRTVDEIVRESGERFEDCIFKITELEMDGIIQKDLSGKYTLI